MHLLANITPFIAFFMAFKSIFVDLKYRMSFEIKSHKKKQDRIDKITLKTAMRDAHSCALDIKCTGPAPLAAEAQGVMWISTSMDP